METIFALLTFCDGNPTVTDRFLHSGQYRALVILLWFLCTQFEKKAELLVNRDAIAHICHLSWWIYAALRYSISQEICTRFCCALLCCGYAIVRNEFTWSIRLPQCQWSKPDGYGKISQWITTTKHSNAKTVCIFLGIYCMIPQHKDSVMVVACLQLFLSEAYNKTIWNAALYNSSDS